MQIKIDTHSHTIMSGHAYSTLQEMMKAAAKKGLQALAITEHGPVMPGTCDLFYFHNVKVIPREFYGVKVLMGVELNITDENGMVDLSESVCRKLDLVIASIHPFCFDGENETSVVTNAYVAAMEKPYIHIIGHPDDSRSLPDYEILVKAAKRTNTLLEVNNSSLSPTCYRMGVRENMLTMLDLCKQYDVFVTTGSDAHIESDVGTFERIQEIFRYCKFPEELIVSRSLESIKPYLTIE